MMPNRLPPAMRRQGGVALLEVLGALAIGAILVMGLSAMIDTSLEDTKGQQAAYYQSQVTDAAQKYIAANVNTLKGLTPQNGLYALGLPALVSAKFLPNGIATKNSYGQVPCVLIRRSDPINFPERFDALIVTTGGAQIPEKILPTVAATAGPGGGYISTADGGNAKGSSWSSSTAAFRSQACAGGTVLTGNSGTNGDGGHLASNLFFNGPGQAGADFLYRNAVPGQPELNRMNTPIRMANAALVTSGSSCLDSQGDSYAAIAIDSTTRGLLVCGTNSVWSSPTQWKDPVQNYANLPGSGNTAGDVRMVKGLSRAFTYNGANWVALAVDQSGNMSVPGTLTAGNVTTGNVNASGNMVVGGTIHATGDISTSNNVSADNDVNAAHAVNAKDVYVAHNVVTEGLQVNRWTSSPAVSIGINYFVAGAACHYAEYDPWENTTHITFPVGTIVMDSNYRPLICGADKTMRYANGTYSP